MKQQKIFALGFFDGVHLGHQALLQVCCRLAEQKNCTPAAVTFDLPPGAVLQNTQPNMLTIIKDRECLLRQYGMEEVQVLTADQNTLSMSWETFLQMLVQENAAGFVCGYDFRFGRNGEGTAHRLQSFAAQHGLVCEIIPEQVMDGEKISSSRIRTLLEQGDVANANRLLGHPHVLTGTVVSGRHLGRTMGIPTANLQPGQELLPLAYGVYACKVTIDGKTYAAVTNIGIRPTVQGEGLTVEPWILDFSGDLYGQEITLQFYQFLRPERKFSDLEELKAQIQKDAVLAREILK